jgi:Domain of unknown function (DUF4410)
MGSHGNPLFSWTSAVSRANSSFLIFSRPLHTCFRFLLIVSLLVLSGCASVSVGNVFQKGAGPKKLPAKIYVQEFEAPLDSFRVDREGNDLKDFIAAERRAMAQALVDQLKKYIGPAEILPDGKSPPHGNHWIVTGIYDRENQGSRALRTIVGFGAGGTKLETRVQVSSLNGGAPTPFLTLLTTGGSAWRRVPGLHSPRPSSFSGREPWPMRAGPPWADSRSTESGRPGRSPQRSRNTASSTG